MYTDEDLSSAVEQGIFTKESVETFRSHVLQRSHTHIADEENLRLITSFNDIFVVIACALLLLSSAWVSFRIHPAFAAGVVAMLSWGLAEFFVLKRKMALPAIVLLMTFIGGVFVAVFFLFSLPPSENSVMLAALAASVAGWIHWKRFRVPITVAAGASTVVTFVVALLISILPALRDYLMPLMFSGGVVIFCVAMCWDAADVKRVTGKSDVAFWLHLAAAPLIVHPIFSTSGVLGGNESLASLATIIALYLLLSLVSLTIDRRAFMVSSLFYVLAALTQLLKTSGLVVDSFAYVGVVIGFSLLLLSGFWHNARRKFVVQLPKVIQAKVPVVV